MLFPLFDRECAKDRFGVAGLNPSRMANAHPKYSNSALGYVKTYTKQSTTKITIPVDFFSLNRPWHHFVIFPIYSTKLFPAMLALPNNSKTPRLSVRFWNEPSIKTKGKYEVLF